MIKNKKTEYFPIPVLRENLRQKATELSNQLSRSVARLTSCDRMPCMEYGDEVKREQLLSEHLFYIQYCRSALERCIGNNGAILRYHWSDGTESQTRFRKIGPNRVKVTGFVPAP